MDEITVQAMSPQDARAWTLKEILDLCNAKMLEEETGEEGMDAVRNVDRYFTAKEIRDEVQTMLDAIKFS